MAKLNQLSKSPSNPLEINALTKLSVYAGLNCHNVGRILEFDKDTQLCTVEMLQIKQFNTKSYIPAPITDVPLIILGAGSGENDANITMPNPIGSLCLLIFMDRNIESFIETGEAYVPETGRMHDFTDCIALCGFKTLVNSVKDYDENAITLINSKSIENVVNTSSVKVYPNLIELLTSGKIRIANNKQNLAGLMQSFLTACENIAVDTQTGLLTASSKQAFTDLRTQFNELLTATGYTETYSGGGGGEYPSGLESYIQKIDKLESDVAALKTSTSDLNYSNISNWLSIDYSAGYGIGNSFTAPSAGIVVCWANMGNRSTTINVNGHPVAILADAATGSTWSTATILVNTGDIVTGMTQNKYFYPEKGEN